MANRCGCNHWIKPTCPARNCPWQGQRPTDAIPERCQHGVRWENRCLQCDASGVKVTDHQTFCDKPPTT